MSRQARPSEIANALDRAADYIETHGWIRHESEDERGRVCLIGAVDKVTDWRKGIWDEADTVLTVAVRHDYPEFNLPSNFNDAQRDRRKVVRFLRRTARRLRNREIVRHWVGWMDGGWYEYSFAKEGNK